MATRKPIEQPADASDRDAHWLAWALARTRNGNSDHTGYELAQQLYLDAGVRDIDATLRRYAREATFDSRHPFTDGDIDRWLRSASASALVARGEPARNPKRQAAKPARASHKTVGNVTQADDAAPAPSQPERPKLRAVPKPGEPSGGADEGNSRDVGELNPPTERRGYHRTEGGNAARLLDAYGSRLRYTKAAGYVAWDGKRWRAGAELQAEQWAQAVIRQLYQEAADLASAAATLEDDGERQSAAAESQELMKWAIASEKAKMMTAMLMYARSSCAVELTDFDREPWLFNCQNGTLDLRSGTLREHRQSDFLMQISPVAYDHDATCPRWEQFLREIMLDDLEMVAYLQRVFGYALSGDTSEQEWYLMVGEGENGKSVLMETVAALLGEYAHMMTPETITITGQPRRGQEASPDIAMLKGKRFVRVTETQEGARIDAARIKSLTGSDEQTARFLHKDFFTFRPTAKMFVYTNHRPESRETTHAFWRRVRYIPFDLNLREHPERKDERLQDKLRAELPGILAWIVRGCLAWQQQGLKPPQKVVDAVATYRADSDVLKDFLDTHCVVHAGFEARATPLYARYVEWCKETGEHAWSANKFGKSLSARGFTRKTNNGTVYVGIGLRAESQQQTFD